MSSATASATNSWAWPRIGANAWSRREGRMRTMPRRVCNIAAAAATTLAVAVISLWLYSYWHTWHAGEARIGYVSGFIVEHRSGLFSSRGTVRVGVETCGWTRADYLKYIAPRVPGPTHRIGWSMGPHRIAPHYRDGDFILGFGRNGSLGADMPWHEDHYGVYSVPHGYLALLPATAALTFRRAAQRRYKHAILAA